MNTLNQLPATTLRVERHTAPNVNEAIRGRTDAELMRQQHAQGKELDTRLGQVSREWDVERVLQANAATLSLVGVVLGARIDRRFLLLPIAVWAFLAQHALQGWCPPLPVLRRLGVRTIREIERERYALKAMRGDFEGIHRARSADAPAKLRAVLEAIDA